MDLIGGTLHLRGMSVLHLGDIIIDETGNSVYRRGSLLWVEEVEVLRRMRCDDGWGADHGVLSEAHGLVYDRGLVHWHDSSPLHLQYWHWRQRRNHVTHLEFASF